MTSMARTIAPEVVCAKTSVPTNLRPRGAQNGNRSDHQQPEWHNPRAWNGLQGQSRQEQPLPAQDDEQKHSGYNIQCPPDRRREGREGADDIGNACDDEGKGKSLFREFKGRGYRVSAARLFA